MTCIFVKHEIGFARAFAEQVYINDHGGILNAIPTIGKEHALSRDDILVQDNQVRS